MQKQIIKSILDNDLYKFIMQQCVFHQYPIANVKYLFKCRNKGVKLGFLIPEIRDQINMMADLSLSEKEKNKLSNLSFLRPDYLQYLKRYRFNPNEVNLYNIHGELIISIRGTWLQTILWEVPLLAIVNQLYFNSVSDFRKIRKVGFKNLLNKINLIQQYPRFIFADFGTRRRYSTEWHHDVVSLLHESCPQLIGSSNVKIAMDLGIKPIGTMAHEYISAHLGLVYNIREAQKRAFYVWLQEYVTDLGIALTDTFTTKAFYKDFDVILAKGFSGVRQDSGDPIEFGYKMIDHYKKLGIDPKTKTIVFSDGLTVPKAIEIYKEFTGMVGLSFGIGTNLTNDLGVTPLNIVIKLTQCGTTPAVKLSDNVTKAIGDETMIQEVRKAYKV